MKTVQFFSDKDVRKDLAIWVCFALLLATLVVFNIFCTPTSGDLELYWRWSSQFHQGMHPYLDYNIAYPPGALIIMLIPSFFAADLVMYQTLFTIFVALFLWIGGVLLYRRDDCVPFLYYSACLMLMQPEVLFQRLDAVIGVGILIMVYQLRRKNFIIATLMLAILTSIKLFPIILLPFFYLTLPNRREVVRQAVVYCLAVIVLFVPFYIHAWSGWVFLWEFHKLRGINIDSIWASLAYILEPNKASIHIVFNFLSQNMETHLTPLFMRLAMYVTLAGQVVLFLGMLFVPERKKLVPEVIFLSLTMFILWNKVFSTQYILWIIPLFILVADRSRKIFSPHLALLFLIIIYLTYLIYPPLYGYIIDKQSFAFTLLNIRNGALFVLMVSVAYNFFRAHAVWPRHIPVVLRECSNLDLGDK